ncbi:MAG TPA: hypothetical protein VF171_02885 [Trueperaceae bacterium]
MSSNALPGEWLPSYQRVSRRAPRGALSLAFSPITVDSVASGYNRTMFSTSELFDAAGLPAELQGLVTDGLPWEVLARLDAFLAEVRDGRHGDVHPTAVVTGPVYLAPGASIGPHACVRGPAWIGAGADVDHGAYLRGGVVLAPGAHVGHASEVKHSLLLSGAKAPHFNYVGDAVLGRDVNLGAGVKIANLNTFGTAVKVAGQDTGLRKFGAAVGDGVSIGCNAVLAPGTVVGPRVVVYHGAMLRGVVPADTIVKLRPTLEHAPRH